MNHVRMPTISTVFSALFVLAVPIVRAQDMVKVAPKNCKVLLDNDRVRVIRVVTKPGEKLEKHSHPDYIIYALTQARGSSPPLMVREKSGHSKLAKQSGPTRSHTLSKTPEPLKIVPWS